MATFPPLIVARRRDISSKIDTFIRQYKWVSRKPIVVIDVHQTALNATGLPNSEVHDLVRFLRKRQYNLVFMSFDGSDKRIGTNVRHLRNVPAYRKIPCIFLKKRRCKGQAVAALVSLLDLDRRHKTKAVLIDDNAGNIEDVTSLGLTGVHGYYYTRYSTRHREEGQTTLKPLKKHISVLKDFQS